MKSVGIVFTAFAIALIFGSLNIPASGNVPPNGAQLPSPQTECEKYVATAPQVRIQQWIATLQMGLTKNPELGQPVWECVMEFDKILVTDRFVLNACTDDKHSQFEPVVFKALEGHLDQCGISIQR